MRRIEATAPRLFGVGLVAALVGLLPWFVTGLRLPLQNLWVADTMPESMPIVLLPFSQYSLTLLASVLLTGAAIAGAVGRSTRSQRPRRGVVALVAGVLVVQIVALVQTSIVVAGGLGLFDGSATQTTAAAAYLAALVVGSLGSIAVGAVVLVLIARAPGGGAVVGIAVAAFAVASWVGGLLLPLGGVSGVSRWIPAIIIGLAVVRFGIGTVGRIVAAVVGIALLVVVPALTTAISSAAGTRVLLPYPAEMADYARGVFVSAVSMPELTLPPVILAVAIVIAGLVVRRMLGRSGSSAAAPTPRPHQEGTRDD